VLSFVPAGFDPGGKRSDRMSETVWPPSPAQTWKLPSTETRACAREIERVCVCVWVKQSIDLSIHQTIKQSINQTINQTNNQSVKQSFNL